MEGGKKGTERKKREKIREGGRRGEKREGEIKRIYRVIRIHRVFIQDIVKR